MKCYVVLRLALLVAPFQSVKVKRRDDAELNESRDDAELTEHPMKRVIRLMQELDAKSVEEGNAEAITYERFKHWCGLTDEELTETIAKEKDTIDQLKLEAKAKRLDRADIIDEIESLNASEARLRKKSSDMDEDRRAHVAEYTQTAQDLKLTISSIGDALTSLEATQKHAPVNKAPAAAAPAPAAAPAAPTFLMIQKLTTLPLMLVRLSDAEQALLLDAKATASAAAPTFSKFSLAEAAASPAAAVAASPVEPPHKAHVYDFKTGKVVDLLKKLKIGFEDELRKAEVDELRATGDYQLANATINDNIEMTIDARNNKMAIKADLEKTLTKLNSDLDSTNSDLDADTTTHKKTTANCKLRADEFNQRTYMRKREREAIAYGIKILNKAAGVRSQAPTAESLLQLKSRRHHRNHARHRARLVSANDRKARGLQLLRRQAMQSGDSDLKRLAMQLEARLTDPDPHAEVSHKVHYIMKKKILALQGVQVKENEKHEWCKGKIYVTENNKERTRKKMELLEIRIEKGEADVESLTEAKEAAKAAIKKAVKDMHELRMQRQETKNENEITIKDSQYAQKALADAIKVMKKYYEGASSSAEAEAASLVQAPLKTEPAPEVWQEKSFTGTDSTGANGNILQVLSQTQEDFGKMEADTKAADEADEKDTQDEMTDLKKKKVSQELVADARKEELTRAKVEVDGWKEDLRGADRKKSLLSIALDDLLDDCNATEYNGRKWARDAEIGGLLNAQRVILDAFNHTNSPAPAPAGAPYAPASYAESPSAAPLSLSRKHRHSNKHHSKQRKHTSNQQEHTSKQQHHDSSNKHQQQDDAGSKHQ